MFTVLGASGVIGRHLVDFLHDRGEEVFTPTRDQKQILFNRPLGTVIYAIGITADFRSKPFATVRAHVSILADILQYAQFDSLLYLSSTRLYSGSMTTSENSQISVNPHHYSDLYNISKLMGESLCLSCGHPEVKIARLANVIGGQDQDSDNFIPSLMREAQSGKITLRTSLSSVKDYIHIDDVTSLLYKISTNGKSSSYNVASGQQVSHNEWINRLKELTGCKVEVTHDAPISSFAPIDITKISTEFGFKARQVFKYLPAYFRVVS